MLVYLGFSPSKSHGDGGTSSPRMPLLGRRAGWRSISRGCRERCSEAGRRRQNDGACQCAQHVEDFPQNGRSLPNTGGSGHQDGLGNRPNTLIYGLSGQYRPYRRPTLCQEKKKQQHQQTRPAHQSTPGQVCSCNKQQHEGGQHSPWRPPIMISGQFTHPHFFFPVILSLTVGAGILPYKVQINPRKRSCLHRPEHPPHSR